MKRVAEEIAHAEAMKKAKVEGGTPGDDIAGPPPFHQLLLRGAPMQMPPHAMQAGTVDAPPPPPPPFVVSFTLHLFVASSSVYILSRPIIFIMRHIYHKIVHHIIMCACVRVRVRSCACARARAYASMV